MKYFLILLIMPLLSAGKCSPNKKNVIPTGENNKPFNDSIPACIQKLIDRGNNKIPDAPLQVDEYKYKGKKVFLFTAQCCDQYNMLYDDSCNAICAPSGGFTGKGDLRCADFDSASKHIRLIWKNPAN